ncbi:MAG: hypothetical protein BWY91_03297 [bacterium ADurb.BinA028]|nr:MAG: hypothetical protein BWY91_03297 [bacterium ADurb.BinA028]
MKVGRHEDCPEFGYRPHEVIRVVLPTDRSEPLAAGRERLADNSQRRPRQLRVELAGLFQDGPVEGVDEDPVTHPRVGHRGEDAVEEGMPRSPVARVGHVDLDLDDPPDGCIGGGGEHLGERGDPLPWHRPLPGKARKRQRADVDGAQLGQGEFVDPSPEVVGAGRPALGGMQHRVVPHDDLVVGGEQDVQLDGRNADVDGRTHAGHSVLRDQPSGTAMPDDGRAARCPRSRRSGIRADAHAATLTGEPLN